MTSGLTGIVIVTSDRILSGERRDTAGPLACELLAEAGIPAGIVVVEEGARAVSRALADARAAAHRVIVTVGGTGLGPRNQVPEATAPLLAVRLDGLVTQVLIQGLTSTRQAGLSRALIGLTGRGPADALIINSPGSTGGVRDTLGVVCPLLPDIFERLC
ncbi:MogA/MoaB family molybdenum cofactor biosynthesis protein [Corynebacterium hylobatis]|uniref:MogA/MoaB family molybdenum cofactor biosynthesis protein n=1 Tax=Corynebacterium hylobatis TaxID=1859290 RepID=A0A430I218_9CORY|nr:molybdopterin-binding protein [Corynebacterium hylobatis]RSZ66179.1 MogA/MoaB family molybdenum cofactor biosynthesis protein [Corynebacterium hylobatis]